MAGLRCFNSLSVENGDDEFGEEPRPLPRAGRGPFAFPVYLETGLSGSSSQAVCPVGVTVSPYRSYPGRPAATHWS